VLPEKQTSPHRVDKETASALLLLALFDVKDTFLGLFQTSQLQKRSFCHQSFHSIAKDEMIAKPGGRGRTAEIENELWLESINLRRPQASCWQRKFL
jgi:hypothetical protein